MEERCQHTCAEPQVKTVPDTLAEVEAETLSDTLGYIEAEPLVDTLVKTITHVKIKTLGDSMGDVETKALIVTLPDTLPDKKVETVFNTLSNVEAEALVDTLADTPEVESKTLSSRLFDVKHQAVVVCAGMHGSRDPNRIGNSLGDVDAKELVQTMADTVKDVQHTALVDMLANTLVISRPRHSSTT